jgi:hypothetical protein
MQRLKRIALWSSASLAALLALAVVLVLVLHRDREISASILIAKPPATVWRILTDTGSYPAWNPMISRVDGPLRQGSVIEIALGTPASEAMVFHPTVLAVRTDHELCWLGHVGASGIFDGRHCFRLEPEGDGTRFSQSEQFSGWLVGRLTDSVLDDTQRQMQAMNLALKRRAEAPGAGQGPRAPWRND